MLLFRRISPGPGRHGRCKITTFVPFFSHPVSVSLDLQPHLWYENLMIAPVWERNAGFCGGNRGCPSITNIL